MRSMWLNGSMLLTPESPEEKLALVILYRSLPGIRIGHDVEGPEPLTIRTAKLEGSFDIENEVTGGDS